MSGGKKGGKATPESVAWDEGLLKAIVEEEDWRPYLVFVCPNTPHDEPLIEALKSSVSGGSRRRFSLIDRDIMLQSAADDVKLAQSAAQSGGGGKKSKAAAAPPVQKPMFVEVCEQVMDAMKSGNPLPASLLAKMIKYKVLRHKTAHQTAAAEKEAAEAAKKQAAQKGDGKGGKAGKGGGGRASKAGKKGKDTPAAADAGPAILLPEKPPTSMKKRGEEDLDSKYIDDEPVDGPTCYFIMTGFSSLDVLRELAPVGITAHVLMKITGGTAPPETQTNAEETDEEQSLREKEEQHKCDLIQFWQGLGQCVQATKDGHMLRDMARVELKQLPQPLVPADGDEKDAYGQSLFDAVSEKVYCVLEQSAQYRHYISYLTLRHLSIPSVPARESSPQSPLQSAVTERHMANVNMTLYNDLLSSVPQKAITVPLILHCMKEQVCASLSEDADSRPSPTIQQAMHDDVLAEITNTISSLCVPTSEKMSLVDNPEEIAESSGERVTVSIEHWDQLKLLSHHLSNVKPLNVGLSQTNTNNRAILGEILSAPLTDTDKRNIHLAMLHSVQHHCTSAQISPQLLNHALIVLSLEHIHLPNAASFPVVNTNTTPLQFDHPLDIAIKEKSDSTSVALVPYNDGTTIVRGVESHFQYQLNMPTCCSSLADYTVCEPMSKDSLLQLLQCLQTTHPYLSVYSHNLSQSSLVVAHCGFDGKPLHSYSWESLAHSRVGFSNYLQYIARQFGEEIDRAVEEDEERRETLEEERQRLIDAREKEVEDQRQTLEKLKEEQEEPATSAKGDKKSAATSAKKTPSGKKSSKLDTTCATPEPAANDTTLDIEASLPTFEERKLYEAYDVGDTVLLNRGTVSVQFLSDGSQIYTEKTINTESDTMLTVSTLCNGHRVSCSVIKRAGDGVENKGECKEDETVTEDGQSAATGIPQPPDGVKFASLTAGFSDSLHISVSHFGPKGTGELPFEPPKPAILLDADSSDTATDSRPQSRQTPQKMNKKQMEQQQQLLEEQRRLEEQRKKEREEAQREYDAQYSALKRENKYQQLFISTPHGLHVHCQVSVDEDSTIMDGSDGAMIVQQSYPLQRSNTQQKKAKSTLTAYSEIKRYYLPDGSVLCFLKDGSLTLLSPDGHVYQTASKSLRELYDNNSQSTGDDSVPTVQPTFSDIKVTFADQIPIEERHKRNLSDTVWLVTTPAGHRYLWKSPDVSTPTDEIDNSQGDANTSEEVENVPETTDPKLPSPQGKIVPLPPAKVFAATDPVTKQVLINREDKVTMLKDPDGSFVVEHADGTRITATADPNHPSTPLEIMVECPGFARVTHSPSSRQCFIDFPDGSRVVGSTAGHYTIEKRDGYRLEVKPSGEGQYLLQPTTSEAYSFTMSHTGVGNILKARSQASKMNYTVSLDGVPAVSHSTTVPPHPAFSPRYFVVPSNESPYQLLSQTEMNSFLAAMESQSDTTIVKGVAVPGFEGSTVSVMKALRKDTRENLPYKNGSIIPKNLSLSAAGGNSQKNMTKGKKRFGVGVGKSLSILANTNTNTVQKVEVPTALQCRQFVNFEQFNATVRNEICDGLASYIASREEQKRREDELLPVDCRGLPERQAARDLKEEWLTKLSGEILSLAVHEVQQQNPPGTNDSDKEPAKLSLLDGIRRDLEQAEQDRAALCSHTVPQYFESDQGRQFLKSQSPDMALLARQLAQPKHHAQEQPPHPASEESHSSTPSTLQSASIVLRPVGGGDSPDVGEVDTVSVSSVNRIRPAHPTPDHAQGLHTPTDVRPTNPTPFHANRSVHSPAISVISQPDTTVKAPKHNNDELILESDSTAERSVSFILPPRRPSIVIGESSLDAPIPGSDAKSQGKTRDGVPTSRLITKVCTSSTMTGGGGLMRGFEVQPQSLEFGVVREGCTYALTLVLKNIGIDPCRFKIKQPPPSTGIKVVYTPGPVAAGMIRKCEVELFAIAAGVVGSSGTGYISHDLEVVSEVNILRIPVQAAVLTAAEYEARRATSCPRPAPEATDVRRIERPSSREELTRPPKAS